MSRLFQQRGDVHWVEWLWNPRVEYWAIRSPVPSFARTAHSFACSALLASLARPAALTRSLARSLRSSWERSFRQWIEYVNFMQIKPTVDSSNDSRAYKVSLHYGPWFSLFSISSRGSKIRNKFDSERTAVHNILNQLEMNLNVSIQPLISIIFHDIGWTVCQ